MTVCFCRGLRLFTTKESLYCVYFSNFMSMIWLILYFHHDKMFGILGIKLLQIILNIIFDHYDILSIITLIRLYLKYFIFWYSFYKICCRKKGKSKNKAAFGSCKSIFGKYFIFRKCYLSERKMYLGVWLRRNSFYKKSILVFGSYKHFTENDFRFTENQFPCLLPSNILQKMKFFFYKKSFLMFGL